jgi:anti-sigma28 factor (negative regulator of flagellin synthesis)
MSGHMAASTDIQLRKGFQSAPVTESPASVSRQLRVEELRRQVAQGTYKVHPERLALKILVRALRDQT